jgi:hypothetical protein
LNEDAAMAMLTGDENRRGVIIESITTKARGYVAC